MLAYVSTLLPVPRLTVLVCIACWIALATLAARAYGHAQPPLEGPAPALDAQPLPLMHLPDAELVDQHGEKVRLRELVAGRRAVINFVFTSCTTVCPPMGALFARLQRDLEARPATERDDIAFVSISIDPAVDTPERLREWAARFDGSSSWRLLTGPKPVVDEVLEQLGVLTPLIEEHTPLVLLGDAEAGRWVRAHGLALPSRLIEELDRLAPDKGVTTATSSATSDDARAYFTDTVLLDQHARPRRFYSDLIADRTVVIHPFFATCTGSCPVMHQALRRVRDSLGDRLGREVFFLSITVDPEHDTPDRLRAWAEAFGAGEGWSFLTGAAEDVERVLARLGQQVSEKEAHQAIFLVGNARTGLWQKVFGLGPPEDLIAVVREVAADEQRPPSRPEESGLAPASSSAASLAADSPQTLDASY